MAFDVYESKASDGTKVEVFIEKKDFLVPNYFKHIIYINIIYIRGVRAARTSYIIHINFISSCKAIEPSSYQFHNNSTEQHTVEIQNQHGLLKLKSKKREEK